MLHELELARQVVRSGADSALEPQLGKKAWKLGKLWSVTK